MNALLDKMLAKALQSQDAETRSTLFELVASQVAADHGFAAAIPYSERLPADTGERDTFLGAAATIAAAANLDATVATLQANPKLRENEEIVAAVALTIAKTRGVPAAIAWVQANVPAAAQTAAYTPMAVFWADSDPAAAAQWAHTLADPSTLAEVLTAWGDKDLPTTVKWLKDHLTPEDQLTLMSTAFTGWSQKRPLDAAKIAVAELSPEVARTVLPSLAGPIATDPSGNPATWYGSLPPDLQTIDVRTAIVLGWISRDPSGAILWLQGVSSPIDFPDAWKKTAQQWAQNDPASLDKWLKEVSPNPIRDTAVRAYAVQLAFSDVITARNVAGQLADPGQRAELIKEVNDTADAIKAQLAAGGTPGMIFLDENGHPLRTLPKDISIQAQGPAGNTTPPPASGNSSTPSQ
jgi:hypothetical protein